MAVMGRPVSAKERSFTNVTMAPKTLSREEKAEINDREKERLLNNITGFKGQKNDLYVDQKSHNKMGKDEFLKLLTVQLENQDPMNPMEQGKMAAELAQFSQLEQLANLNTKFDKMNGNQAMEDKFYGASFLGKEVVTTGSSLEFKGEGTTSDILYTLPKPADKVLIRIFDSNNSMVGEIWKENIGRGNQTESWDGMQLDGAISGSGQFKTQVYAWDQFADPIEVKTKTTGRVESVFFENGETVLKVDGKKVFLRDVDSFHNPGALQRGEAKVQRPSMPNVQAGKTMESAIPSMNNNNTLQAKNNGSNLPLDSMNKTKVNLNKINNQAGLNAYRQQEPTTGLTSVYDVE
jgi:flagellar basal-body rod modification protein FlgD